MREDLWTVVDASLQQHRDRVAWSCRLVGGEHRDYSYGQIREFALTLAAELRARGVGPGDVVAILAVNGPEWGAAALAVWKLGAMIAPIHTALSEPEMASQIAALRPRCILVHGVQSRLPNAEPILLRAEEGAVRDEATQDPVIHPDTEALRSCTSGSTGVPKMVMLSHRNILSNVRCAAGLAGIGPHDRFLSLLPLSHMMEVTGGLLLPLTCGASIVLPRALAANEILQAMAEERITAIIAVPRLYRNIMLGLEKRFQKGGAALRLYRRFLRHLPLVLRRHLNAPIRRRLGGQVRFWISGGSRLDPDITRFFHDLGLPLRQGYGLTETSPVVCLQDEFDAVPEGVGRPVPGVSVRIHDADADGAGELWVRGPNVMLGYVDPAHTAAVMEGEWFRTGDLARIDEGGRVILTGRCKRLIVTEAGKNVYPEDLETLLERIPGVREAGVIEVDMRPAAVMAVEGPNAPDRAREILKTYNAGVSSHNQIARFALVDELPRTPVGKVAISRLPDIFAEHEVTR